MPTFSIQYSGFACVIQQLSGWMQLSSLYLLYFFFPLYISVPYLGAWYLKILHGIFKVNLAYNQEPLWQDHAQA